MSEAQEGLGSLFDPEVNEVAVPACAEDFDCKRSFTTNGTLMYGSSFLARYAEGKDPKGPACKVHYVRLRLAAVNESVRRTVSERPWLSRRALHYVLTQKRSVLAERGKNYFLVTDSSGSKGLWVCVQHLTTLWKVYTIPPISADFSPGERIFFGE